VEQFDEAMRYKPEVTGSISDGVTEIVFNVNTFISLLSTFIFRCRVKFGIRQLLSSYGDFRKIGHSKSHVWRGGGGVSETVKQYDI
jgi:hypothetical protein